MKATILAPRFRTRAEHKRGTVAEDATVEIIPVEATRAAEAIPAGVDTLVEVATLVAEAIQVVVMEDQMVGARIADETPRMTRSWKI